MKKVITESKNIESFLKIESLLINFKTFRDKKSIFIAKFFLLKIKLIQYLIYKKKKKNAGLIS